MSSCASAAVAEPGAANAWRRPRRPTGGGSLSSGSSLGGCPCEFAFGRKCETPSTPDKTSLQNPHFVQSIAPGPNSLTYFSTCARRAVITRSGVTPGMTQALFASIHLTCLPPMVCRSLKRISGVAFVSPSSVTCSSVLYKFGGYPALPRSTTSLFSPLLLRSSSLRACS